MNDGLRAVHRGVEDQGDHRGEDDQGEGAGVEQGEEDEHPDRRADGPDEVDRAPAEAVGQVAEPGDQEHLARSRR